MSRTPTMRYRCDCGGRLYVKETRASNDAIYRTRQCRDCQWLFNTVETVYAGGIPNTVRRPATDQGAKP